MDISAYLVKMRLVAYLAGCVVRGAVPEAARLDCADPDELLEAAETHTLAAIAAAGLEAAGLGSHGTAQESARGVWKATQLEADWQPVRAELEAAGIWYCPLKGAVVKDLYPAYGLRQMADYDVLFDAARSDDVRDIMVACGFSRVHFGTGAHDSYYKLPVSNFEMHRRLFAESCERAYANHFADIKERLLKDANNACGWHMGLEDFYLYLLAHEHKHYSGGGTGLRSPLDIYVYLRAYGDDMDWERVRATAAEIGLFEFEEQQRSFAQHLFDDVSLTADEEELFVYLATSGTYGTVGHRVENKLADMRGVSFPRLRYVRERLFPPLDESYSAAYPFFGKHRWLLPAFWVYRLGKGMFRRRRVIAAELEAIARTK